MSSTPAERFRDLADAIDHALKRGARTGEATPVPEPVRELLEPLLDASHGAAAEPAGPDEEHGSAAELPGLQPGRSLGEFELVRELGRGGMGAVWEARQLALGRSVALKLLPLGPGVAARALARFKREGIAGASVQHPGITAVYDTGVHGGIAWIAQELVGGGRTLADRLAELRRAAEVPESHYRDMAVLFARIARALHAAHEAHVIHRDVKPSNVLLTAEGEPKLADFGLAKLLDEPGVSRSGQFAGSPCYASPEQAAGDGKSVDARSDVFSLGTSLYEALVLSRPFDGDTSHQVLLRILRDDPQDPRLLRSRVPAELAAITLRCLEKRRERRYPSALALAEDLERWLRHQPVLARPPSVLTRGRKWMRRNPAPATGIAVFALGFAVALGQLYQNTIALARAETAEQVATRAKDKESKTRVFLASFFLSADPTRNFGNEASAKELLDAAPERARSMWSEDPESLALILRDLGSIHQNRSEMEAAGQLYREAMGLAAASVGRDTELYFSLLNNQAQVEGTLGHAEEAQRMRDELAQLLEHAGDWANSYKLLARLNAAAAIRREKPAEAEAELIEIDRLDRVLPKPWDKVHNGVLFNRAQICLQTGRNDEALELLGELLQWQQANLDPDHPDTLRALEAKQTALVNAGRQAEALPLAEDVLARLRGRLPPKHRDLYVPLVNAALNYVVINRYADALPLFEEAQALESSYPGLGQGSWGKRAMNHAWCLYKLGRLTDAEREYRTILDPRAEALGLEEVNVVKCRASLGLVLLTQHRPAEAIDLLEPALAWRRAHLEPRDPGIVGVVGYLAEAYADAGRNDDARSGLQEWLANADPKDPQRARRGARLASLPESAPATSASSAH